MLVAVDIGNSNIVVGLYHQHQWLHQWRMETLDVPPYVYEMKLRQLMLDAGVGTSDMQEVVISSVVPQLTQPMAAVWHGLLGIAPYLINPLQLGEKQKMKLHNPIEIGSDLVANAVAAYRLFQHDCLVVDFGTALSFTSISKNEEVIGVSIVPGIKTAIKALTQNTAKLPAIELELPDSVLGQDTVHAIRSGILYGYVGLVKEIISRNKTEVGADLKVVATGGLSHVLHPLKGYFDEVIPTLTLDGLRILHETKD